MASTTAAATTTTSTTSCPPKKLLLLTVAALLCVLCAPSCRAANCSSSNDTHTVKITFMMPYQEHYKFSRGKIQPAVEQAFVDSYRGDALAFTGLDYECLLNVGASCFSI